MADSVETPAGEETLESQLEQMLEIEKFDPPEEFVKNALLNDPSVYDEAERDWQGWWVKQAKELHWFKEPTEVLDDSNPPFYKWFTDGKINASYNCLDRHVEAGRGERVAFHWRGEEGEERDITYADLHRDVQKFANALKDLGVQTGRHRRHLPADDPRGRGGNARLRTHRRAAQRGVRRLLGRLGQGADGVLARPRPWSPSMVPAARARRPRSSSRSTP